jgi:hypothetical protein
MPPLATKVIVFCWETPMPSEDNARSIAEFMGADASVVSVATASSIDSIRRLVPPAAAVIVHADTLGRIAEVLDAGVDALLLLLESVAHILIYGFSAADCHAAILRTLSSGGLLKLEPLSATDTVFQISSGYRELFRQLSGLSVPAVDPTRDSCFVEGASDCGQSAMIRAASRPFFVRVDRRQSEFFFLACGEFGNLKEKVSREPSLLHWFSRLLPLMIFLRSALGNNLWRSDLSQACFIIDDPFLKPRYGFLEYQKLLEAINQLKFSACIAFIPWNYRRSRQQIADRISVGAASLSLCVHGCDHTRGEFAATDFELLRDKAGLALDRMRSHRQRSGAPFDDVMVFPQGLFSYEALEALDACGYLAAVNTDLRPSGMPESLTLEDLLDVAITKFGGFPLFGRHYPRDLAQFAFDLFLGKPALIVEHHSYFRNGYEEIRSFVGQLNQLDEQLDWHNPAAICSRACLKKVMPNGEVHTRFYTKQFQLTNRGAESQAYVLLRQWTGEKILPKVTVDGRESMREEKNGTLAIPLSLNAGQTVDVRIISERSADTIDRSWKPTSTHAAKVFVRRTLCEFRDDHVETNPVLRSLLSSTRKLRTKQKGAVQPVPQSGAGRKSNVEPHLRSNSSSR